MDGMSDIERLVGDAGDVPDAGLGDVRDVNDDAEAVALPHQAETGLGEAGTGVGARGKGEGHAVAEGVGPAPNRAKRAQAGGVKHRQGVEVGVECLAALHVEDGGEQLGGAGGFDVGDGAAKTPGPSPVEPECNGGYGQRRLQRRGGIERVWQRQAERRLAFGRRTDVRRRQDDGAEAADEAARLGARAVDMADGHAAHEFLHRVGAAAGMLPQTQQDVVVPVKNRLDQWIAPCRCERFPSRAAGRCQRGGRRRRLAG